MNRLIPQERSPGQPTDMEFHFFTFTQLATTRTEAWRRSVRSKASRRQHKECRRLQQMESEGSQNQAFQTQHSGVEHQPTISPTYVPLLVADTVNL